MDGLFEDFEVLTFLNDDVFVLRMGVDLNKNGLHQLSTTDVVKMVTKDFLVKALIFHGDILQQGNFILEVGQIAKSMYDARKMDPKAPYFPSIYLYTDKPYTEMSDAILRRLRQFTAVAQFDDVCHRVSSNNYQKIEDTSWNLKNI